MASEIIVNIKAIYAQNYQEKMLDKYKHQLKRSTLIPLWIGMRTGLFYGVAVFILQSLVGVIYYTASVLMIRGHVFNGLDLNILFIVIIWTGLNIGNNFYYSADLAEGKLAAKNLFAILDTPDEEQTHEKGNALTETTETTEEHPQQPTQKKGKIEFRNVSFAYPNSHSSSTRGGLVLRNLSLTIEAGQKVAIVGPSGCGKSTLVQLLLGFYPHSGCVLLDGVSSREHALYEYRRNFATVSQMPDLFVGSVSANVRYSLPASDQQTLAAAAVACAFDVSLPPAEQSQQIAAFLGKSTGSKGSTKISGGEKQRVAIARAVLKDAPVLVLDEGTASLDGDTERRVR